MNEPVRIVADWLNGTTSGSTSVAATLDLDDFPKDAADSFPADPTHYDATRHGFAARGVFPRDGSVTYPCVVVGFAGMRYEKEAEKSTENAKLEEGEAQVAVTVAHRLQDSDEGVEDVGYLVRAVKGSLTRFHKADGFTARTRNGFRLLACTSLTLSPVRAEDDDKLIGTQLLLTYTTHETTPD